MGLLDKIKELAGSMSGDNDQESIFNGIADLFKTDGLDGIVENFTKGGLGEKISSWIGSGSNLPISADQIKDALGSEKLEALAQKAGVPIEKVSQYLKDMLPDIVDKITPGGKIDEDSE